MATFHMIWANGQPVEYARFAGNRVQAVGLSGIPAKYDESRARRIAQWLKRRGYTVLVTPSLGRARPFLVKGA